MDGAEPVLCKRKMNGPCAHCINPEDYEILESFNPAVSYCRCKFCNRRYILAELFLDAMCIETIDQLIWKEFAELPDTNDIVAYILDHKPYYASSSGGPFHLLEDRPRPGPAPAD